MTAENDSLFNILVLREVSYLFNEKVFIQLKKNQAQIYYPQTFQVLSHCISTVDKIKLLYWIGTGREGET